MAKGKTKISTIGSRVRQLREASNMSQSELARIMKMSRETLNHWENNAREIKASRVVKLAELFNVSCDYILTGVSTDNIETYRQTGLQEKAIHQLKLLYDERHKRLFVLPPTKSDCFNYMLSNENFMPEYPSRLLDYCSNKFEDDEDSQRTGNNIVSKKTGISGYWLKELMQELADAFYSDVYKPIYKKYIKKSKALTD